MKTLITDFLLSPPNLNDQQLRALTGALKNHLFLDQPIPYDKFADITYEREFSNLEIPKSRIVKMAKKEHVDAFFQKGTLQLGTFEYYRNFENMEVRDEEEGSTILVGSNSHKTAVITITGGFDHYTFCCFDGEPDPQLIDKFGYDSYFEIIDADGFENAISKKLNALSAKKSLCIYKSDKVMISEVQENFNFGSISSHMENLASMSKFFLKNTRFKHQNEYRFTWRINDDVQEPVILDFPEAVEFCKRKS